MSRVIAVMACGLILAACSMSMPSLDFFRSGPSTETLRIESEPPGADARTAEGQSCRTPCELTVPSAGEVAVSFALPGYQTQTIAVRSEAPPSAGYGEGGGAARMQPNPVYAELQPAAPPRQQKKKAQQKKKVAKKAAPPPSSAEPVTQPSQTEGANPGTSNPYPSNYPWPPPPPPQ